MGRNLKDYTGTIHGCWKVIERDQHPISKSHETFWISECQNCGNIASVRKTDLDKNPNSCNNCKGSFIADAYQIGDKYGQLTIIGRGQIKNNHSYAICQCNCGNIVEIRVAHLKGQNRHKTISCGCANVSSGELKIRQLLLENNINFQEQYRIKDFSLYAPFDFAIFDNQNNLLKLIEYDGEQHFQAVDFFGGEEQFQLQQERDKKKNKWCEKNNIKLQRIPYQDYDKITIDYLLS